MTSQIAVIRATLRYATQEEFIAGMKPLLSKRGLFINTCATRPVGSEVRFEFSLADGSVTYAGEGIVRKEVPFIGGTSTQKSGMLVTLTRVNRPFKAVVDAVLNDSESGASAPHAVGRQFIVESRAGEHQGFDLFGDIDLDEGLDSLFSGIAKKPAKTDSGIYEPPTVVSGMFRAREDEIALEYRNSDLIDVNAQHAPVSRLANPLGERFGASRLQEKSRAVTGQYSSVADNIAVAEREAAQGKMPSAPVKFRGATTAEFDEAPTVNEMRAIIDVKNDDPDAGMPSGDEGNMFGDALDFENSPVLGRMEREFEIGRQNADRDDTPVRTDQVRDEDIAQYAAPAQAEIEAFARNSAESFDYGQPNAESFDYGQQPAEFFDYGQQPAESFEYGQQPAESFDYGQQPAESFNYGQPNAESFDENRAVGAVYATSAQDEPLPETTRDPESPAEPAEDGSVAQNIESGYENESDFAQNAGFVQSDAFHASINRPETIAAEDPKPIFQISGDSVQETPSELFEALQADILREPSGEMPSVEAAILAAQAAGQPESDLESAATVAIDQPDFSNIVRKSPIPIKLASQAEVCDAKPVKKSDISLDDLISKPVARRASQPQSTGDIINADMSKISRPVPRKSEHVKEDMPAPKKGGFFSNLFKK